MVKRFERIIGWSGAPAGITVQETRYVVPGALITVKDGSTSVPVWIGVNGPRIFYILRMGEAADRCEAVFRFAFGGAAKVGWSFLYEPLSGTETSVWGTAETGHQFVSGTKERSMVMTQEGEFWINDLSLMMLSALRTIQRESLIVSPNFPEPL